MKISVIGAGGVGSATAFALMMRSVAGEIVLVDLNKSRAEAEAADIAHATTFSNASRISAGDYDAIKDSNIVIITAGANQKPGQTRTDLLAVNVKIFTSIVHEIVKYAPNCIIIVASNPVDVMANVTLELSGFPKERVIGSGTVLDTSRFRALLGEYLGVSPQSVHANVLGEHGDSEVLVWSNAEAAAVNVMKFAKDTNKPIDEKFIAQMNDDVINAAYKIINGKGSTFYGIAGCLSRLCRAISKDERAIFTVSSLQKEVEGIKDVYTSYPTIIGKHGIETVIYPELSAEEHKALKKSISTIKENSVEALKILRKN
ncbi:MAG: L-lactate dehydrogenase [Alphaproteobacteria bacterium]|nr:L-lactate dehydrogenase [Alphaproteobacteria bacterium]